MSKKCLLSIAYLWLAGIASATSFYIRPDGNDSNPGTKAEPFQTLERAVKEVRAINRDMRDDIVVHLAAGEYRLPGTITFGPQDSGRNGHRVIYRSADGPGAARLLGSRPVTGWKEHRDGIWKVPLDLLEPFHTLYEAGRRARKARLPNHQFDPAFPTAEAPYFVAADGSPRGGAEGDENTSWIAYREADFAPGGMDIQQMKINVFPWGTCDWHRWICQVTRIDEEQRRIYFGNMGDVTEMVDNRPCGARYWLEDHYGFLDAPGEFHFDADSGTLYYIPMGDGHPDDLSITFPVLHTLIRLQGDSKDSRVENITLSGLAFAETDGISPTLHWWTHDWGLKDHALVWMNHARGIHIEQCHFKNSGRTGIMMAGGNLENRVVGCWIEQMGINGITLSNRFPARRNQGPSERNILTNNRIHDVGQLGLYASCINVMNSSFNEISYSELFNSPRYAITLRGNTYWEWKCRKDPFDDLPPAWGNRFTHLKVFECGHDSGDMGAVHAAGINVEGFPFVNFFEQITIDRVVAVGGMNDYAPDGIFLDWPEQTMLQAFSNIQVARIDGMPLRSNGMENEKTALLYNVSWTPGFNETRMAHDRIGVREDFPEGFGGRGRLYDRPAAPHGLEAKASAHDAVELWWERPAHEDEDAPLAYAVFRDNRYLATVVEPAFIDPDVRENTGYTYQAQSRRGLVGVWGEKSNTRFITTPRDQSPLVVKGAMANTGGTRIALLFNKPVEKATAEEISNYQVQPQRPLARAEVLKDERVVVLQLKTPLSNDDEIEIRIDGLTDQTVSSNRLKAGARVQLTPARVLLHYTMEETEDGLLLDRSAFARHGRIRGPAVRNPGAGPSGNAVQLMGAGSWIEGPRDLNFDDRDFTLSAWVLSYQSSAFTALMSKGNGWLPGQWTFNTLAGGGRYSFRSNNRSVGSPCVGLPPGEWVHLALVRHGDEARFYINGEPAGDPQDVSGVSPLRNEYPLMIGRRPHEPTSNWFYGLIGDVQIYDHAMDSGSIRIVQKLPFQGQDD